MKIKDPHNEMTTIDIVTDRVQILEEKFEYQERTIDALNDVIIEQQKQLNALEDQIYRLQALLAAREDKPNEDEDPPPPHY
ncbi:MAG: SlyX family protein [Desulforhopalus sp.]